MREIKPTLKDVPSSDINDLFFNSGKVDEFVTSLQHTYTDRFGRCHRTVEGMNWVVDQLIEQFKIDVNQAILAAGYAPVGSFQDGAEVKRYNETVLWKLPDGDGGYYRWDGDLPKSVPENSTPETTGGIKTTDNPDGLWVSVGDASLRSALIKGDGSLIGVGNGNTLDTKLKSMLSAVDYGFVGDIAGDKSIQFDDMLRDAIRANIRVVHFPQKTTFNVESDVLLNRNTILVGNAEIRTTNPNNRYLQCYKEANVPQEISYINLGDLSSFANAILRSRYMGDRKPKVVFIGDSLTMGGQHRYDYSGVADRLKAAIRNGANFDCDFYNRAIAGSAIGEFLGKIPAYATVSEVHGNGEAPWITDKNRTWLSYIEDIQPDLVVIAFGMNAPNANDTHFCLSVRQALKALASQPSIMWVTSPMRTIDVSKEYNGTKFGTYPNNEYSNSAGLAYGGYGRWVGDTVIDVNRASSLTMLGIDPASCSLSPEVPSRHKTTGDATTVINGDGVNVRLNSGAILSSQEYVRDGAVELTPKALNGVLRLRGRNDVNSINTIYVDISATDIKLHAPTPSMAQMGLVKQVTVDTVGKPMRFQFVGTRVFITVDEVIVIDIYDIYAAQFMSNISLQAVSATCEVDSVRFFRGIYKTHPPLLTPDEIFSPNYGLGGNGLNHPNTLGVEYMHGAALKALPKMLNSALLNNALVKKYQVATLSPEVTGTITAKRIGNMIYIEGRDIDGTLDAYQTLTTLDILFYPQDTIYGTAVTTATSGGAATFTGVRIGNNGRIVLTTPLPNNSGKVGFSISYARAS